MDHTQHTEQPYLGPFDDQWTITEIVEWFAVDDARCHDEGCRPVLAALDRALSPAGSGTAASGDPAPVMLLRALVARLAADPALGQMRLAEVLGIRAGVHELV
ncbi:hypothetical protein [Microbacterium sp. No. 7]|uniref:hypothetical protein n=1 Tax=Microbacterium sp. No. 7 TaxID=1714373 RepID=UPI0006CFB6FA|nr:hypothetical protein [Microbacterium sp. No. 7]ALJ21925.1 hypothetical protein AOA12_19295 [Microbacterium sp. No. 7]